MTILDNDLKAISNAIRDDQVLGLPNELRYHPAETMPADKGLEARVKAFLADPSEYEHYKKISDREESSFKKILNALTATGLTDHQAWVLLSNLKDDVIELGKIEAMTMYRQGLYEGYSWAQFFLQGGGRHA